jgi:hypothetical protein
MKKDAKFVIGCFTVLYSMAFLFIAMACNLIYTTGKVVRFDSFHMSRSSTSTPVVEIPVGKTLFRFKGEGMDSHPFSKGDTIPVA